jgi:hypothetical protein
MPPHDVCVSPSRPAHVQQEQDEPNVSHLLRADAHRELRAMLLTAHPCPPLPQIANSADNSVQRVFSSHDFLSTAIDRMIALPDETRDHQRREEQLLKCRELAAALPWLIAHGSTEALYETFTKFARSYVGLYFDPARRASLDIRFCPVDDVCRGDPVHKAACAHLRALRMLRNTNKQKATEDAADAFEHLGYGDVLRAFAREVCDSEGHFEGFT